MSSMARTSKPTMSQHTTRTSGRWDICGLKSAVVLPERPYTFAGINPLGQDSIGGPGA